MKKKSKFRRSVASVLSVALVASSFSLAMPGKQAVNAIEGPASTTFGGVGHSTAYEQGDAPVLVAPDFTLSEGSYADGYLKFEIPDATSSEYITLPNTADVADVTNGNVSVVDSVIYLGDGSAAYPIGSVNQALNGQAGQSLQIDFSTPLENGDFSEGETTQNEDVPGWTINRELVTLGPLASKTQGNPVTITGDGPYTIEGAMGTTPDTITYTFETDFNYDPASTAQWGFEGDERTLTGGGGTFSSQIQVEDRSLRLWFTGNVTSNTGDTYGSAFGPEAISVPFTAKAGDRLSFDWSAANGTDDYEVYGFLVDAETEEHYEILYGRGYEQPWTTASGVVPADGEYYFRFVAGSYDRTGGLALGASLYIDNIRVVSDSVMKDVVEAIARLVTYENTNIDVYSPLDREIHITAKNANGLILGGAADTVTIILDRLQLLHVSTVPGNPNQVALIFNKDIDGDELDLTGLTIGGEPVVQPFIVDGNRVIVNLAEPFDAEDRVAYNPAAPANVNVSGNPNDTLGEIDGENRLPIKDGRLGNLGASIGENPLVLQPEFDPNTTSYSSNVPNSVSTVALDAEALAPSGTMLKVTLNGEEVALEDLAELPLRVGTNTIVVSIYADPSDPRVLLTQYTLVINRAGSGGGGGAPAPATEQILVPVETGLVREGQLVEQTPITRTRENGTVRDEVTFTQDRVSRAIENVRNVNQDMARVVIPDTNDEVSRVDFTLPNNSRAELAGANTNLEIFTENARVIIPNTSLASFAGEIYFRLIPIKEEQRRSEVESRARVERLVREVAGDQEVNVVARPMTIETNLQSRPVTLILPLRDVVLPTNATERTKFLNDLVIFIEHSDGEKRLVRPKVVEYKGNELGLEFGVNKFSTFTILNMEGWQDNFHAAYISGYVDGTFKPSHAITRAEMAAIFARNLGIDATHTSRATYPDVASTHWATKEIEFVRLTGLMVGDNNGNFRPNAPITRAEMAAIAARYKELASSVSSFTDVQATHWAAGSIGAVQQAGIVGGYEDGTFRPNGNLTRAEAVTIVNRLFERGPLYGITTPSFNDVPTTHWAFHEVEEAVQDHFFTPRSEGGENVLR